MKQEGNAAEALQRWLGDVSGASALVALAELSPDAAVFAVDRDRNVVMWSEGAERLLGFKAEEVMGQHCLKANRCANCIAGCGIERFGQVHGATLTMHRADGATLRLKKHAKAFFDSDGNFAGGVEVLTPERAAHPTPIEQPAADPQRQEFHALVSGDPAMHQVFQTVRGVAASDVCALVGGESGTGKELVARALHAESTRARGKFIAINCAALTPTLLESELFGHVKGAFTGAVSDRPGLLSRADGGTLFLDEIAELSLELQAKLLRVVEKACFVPVGGTSQQCVDVRLVAATHRSLKREVKAGRFREDLMYRLHVVPINLPPLRDRRGDVELLLWHFIERRNAHAQRHIESIAPDAMRALLDHRWPGNVRELQNVVAYAFAVGTGPVLGMTDLPPDFREEVEARQSAPTPVASLNPAEDEPARIRAALAQAGGHVGRAAELLGISRPTLWRKRRRYGLVDGAA